MKPCVCASKAKLACATKEYAQVLDAMDKGNKLAAKEALQSVVNDQPDFQLAAFDLDRLMR